jgi:peptidoglycan/xylan/chitin deacetylase (PgdA/CDA1 family)
MLEHTFRFLSHGKLTALLFHKVPQVRNPCVSHEMNLVEFERVLAVAVRLFRIIPLQEAVLALRAGNLPPRAACITFDDGYPDWMHGVVPILERYKAHATFFITSGQFNGLPMWNERILHAVANAPTSLESLQLSTSGLPMLSLGSQAHRQKSIHLLDEFLKYQDLSSREDLLLELEQKTGSALTSVPVMAADDLRAIHAKGFAIGSHTVAHPILTRCDPHSAFNEIAQSREQLEAIVRGAVTAFAYPNGVPTKDFGSEHIEMVRRAGYTCAVTTHWGAATAGTSVFQIPRFTPWGPSSLKMDLQFARNLAQRPLAIPEPVQQANKVLMVAFHFPPQAGSSGILRTLNFVKYLPQNNWAPTVLTASAHAYTEQRNDLVASIPPSTQVLRAFALDTARHLSIAGKYPRIFALPDRWTTWWLHAVATGLRHIRRERPDIIWSTYPISTAHLIAGTLARWSGVPWVADFRDPMVSDGYPSDTLHRRIWQWLEGYVLRNARTCVFTTQRAAATYGKRYPAAAHKCVVIENGYDEEAFVGVQPNRHGTPPGTLLLLHSGLIYPQDRNPSTFFEAVRALIDDGVLDRSRLCIRFRAPHHDDEVKAFAAVYGLGDVVDVAPPIPYRQAIAEMMGADLLLVFQGSYFNAQIPAKIYEYLRAQRPVLAVLDPTGDTAGQLRQFDHIYFGDIASNAAIESELLQWLKGCQEFSSESDFSENLNKVKKYSRIEQAQYLSVTLDAATVGDP